MADLRESFPTLEDVGTQAGVPLHKALEGDAASGKNAHGALVAKDPDGNLIYLKLNAGGSLAVTLDGAKACRSKRGTAVGSATFVDVAVMTLVNEASYEDIDWAVSCFRDAIFEIVYVTDVGDTNTEEILGDVLVGPGAFTSSGELSCTKFTVPAANVGTGVNELRLRAKNLNATSDFRGSISIGEIS